MELCHKFKKKIKVKKQNILVFYFTFFKIAGNLPAPFCFVVSLWETPVIYTVLKLYYEESSYTDP